MHYHCENGLVGFLARTVRMICYIMEVTSMLFMNFSYLNVFTFQRSSLANAINFHRKQRTLQHSYVFEQTQLLALSKDDFKCKCWFNTYTRADELQIPYI